MLEHLYLSERAAEKLTTLRREADQARALRAGANVPGFREAFRKLVPASRRQARERVPASLDAK